MYINTNSCTLQGALLFLAFRLPNIVVIPKLRLLAQPPLFVTPISTNSSEEDELEGFGIVKERDITEANTSQIESPPSIAMEKWVNPTKILKRRVENEKEKTYAVGKGLWLGSWESAQVAETDEEREQIDIEIPDAPPEESKKEKIPERTKPTRKTASRKKYMNVL
jgi:hypothetical protein